MADQSQWRLLSNDNFGSRCQAFCNWTLIVATCCLGCTSEPTDNIEVKAAKENIATTDGSHAIQGKPVVHGEDGPVSIRAALPVQHVAEGKPGRAEVSFKIAPGYHLYGALPESAPFTSLLVESSIAGAGDQEFVPAQLPKPTEQADGLPVYRDTLAVSIPTTVPSNEDFLLTIRIQYQVCSDLACFLPEGVELQLPVCVRSNDESGESHDE